MSIMIYYCTSISITLNMYQYMYVYVRICSVCIDTITKVIYLEQECDDETTNKHS